MAENQGAVVIACAVLRGTLGKLAVESGVPAVFMDYGLHLTPRKMRAALQAEIDALDSPRRVLIGFGLCGNGLAGLKAGCHTLFIPRVDDCISLFLGSRAAYLQEFHNEPATYYLTPGWLECGGEPMSEHWKLCAQYGPARADLISNAMYHRYRRVCLLALNDAEAAHYRPQARAVAEFCRERWGWNYSERIGSDALIRRIFDIVRTGVPDGHCGADELVVIQPGQEVRQELFMQGDETLREESGACTICTIK